MAWWWRQISIVKNVESEKLRTVIDALVSIAFYSFTSIHSNFHNSYRTFSNREIKPDLEASKFKVIPPYSKFKKQKKNTDVCGSIIII